MDIFEKISRDLEEDFTNRHANTIAVDLTHCPRNKKITYTPETVLQFGRHRGKKLKDVKSGYIAWMYRQGFTMDPRCLNLLHDFNDFEYDEQEMRNAMDEQFRGFFD